MLSESSCVCCATLPAAAVVEASVVDAVAASGEAEALCEFAAPVAALLVAACAAVAEVELEGSVDDFVALKSPAACAVELADSV